MASLTVKDREYFRVDGASESEAKTSVSIYSSSSPFCSEKPLFARVFAGDIFGKWVSSCAVE